MTQFASMGIIVVRPPGCRVKFLAERAARATAEIAHEKPLAPRVEKQESIERISKLLFIFLLKQYF